MYRPAYLQLHAAQVESLFDFYITPRMDSEYSGYTAHPCDS